MKTGVISDVCHVNKAFKKKKIVKTNYCKKAEIIIDLLLR